MLFALLQAVLLTGPSGSPPGTSAAVLVEGVQTGAPGQAAGLRPGDVLTAWHRATEPQGFHVPAGGPLESPFDLMRVEVEVAPRVPVVLEGRRGQQRLEVRLHAGDWRVQARPLMAEDDETAYVQGETLLGAGQAEAALGAWLALAERAAARGDWTLACWSCLLMMERAPADAHDSALDPFALAADTCASAGRPDHIAWSRQAAARALQARYRYAEAEAAWREALHHWANEAPGGLAVAGVYNRLGVLFWDQGRLVEAEAEYRRALELRQALAPEGLEVAGTVNNLGLVARWRSQLDSAEALLTRALEIRQRLAPDSLMVADNLLNLHTVALDQGRLAEAQDLARRALASASRIEPDGPAVNAAQLDLGVLAQVRGDFASAEKWYQEALALGERIDPGGIVTAHSIHNLSQVAVARGDWDAAEVRYLRAMDLYRRRWPGSVVLSGALMNLGVVLTERGRFAEAEAVYREAEAILEKMAPGSTTHLALLANRAELAQKKGDLPAFEAQAERALRLIENPQLVAAAGRAYGLMGEVALARGRPVEAEGWFRKVIAAGERFHPGGERQALAWHRLANLHRAAGRVPEAVEAHGRAIDALEAQAVRLGGGGQGRVEFGVRHVALYQDAVETLLQAGRAEEAFAVWERSRARALLEMMAERDFELDADLPDDLRRRRRALNAEYDRIQNALAETSDPAQQPKLLERLRLLRVDQQDLAEQARRASPRLASVTYPQPLSLEQARRALDPGTTLLAFMVGRQASWLFVLQGPGSAEPALSVFRLGIGEAALRGRVTRFRTRIQQAAPSKARWVREEARSLYALLLGPAESRLEGAQRLLLCPDGPLHALPFAALRRGPSPGRPAAYLFEWKPLHVAASVTLYAELRKLEGEPDQAPLVAFGSPRYTDLAPVAARLQDAELQSAVKRGLRLTPLPATRDEVETIGRLFPGALVYTGGEATEERAKAAPRKARYVHFATHAVLDERFHMNSALALATPEASGEGRDNGLLQAWEIMEGLRLHAELVTLSACDSGLGREAAGEGLLGLTRAFHYAGARTVLASLWAVDDISTGVLMKRFYAELQKGGSKDEALRQAQLSLVSSRWFARPFHWAAFQLSGDWK